MSRFLVNNFCKPEYCSNFERLNGIRLKSDLFINYLKYQVCQKYNNCSLVSYSTGPFVYFCKIRKGSNTTACLIFKPWNTKKKTHFFSSIPCHTMIKNLCVSAAPTGKYCNQYSSINLNRRQLKQEVKTCCKEATATASNTGQWKSKAEAGSTKETTGAFQHSGCPQGKIQIYTCISSVLFTKTLM